MIFNLFIKFHKRNRQNLIFIDTLQMFAIKIW